MRSRKISKEVEKYRENLVRKMKRERERKDEKGMDEKRREIKKERS